MASKYDEAWQKIFSKAGGLDSIFQEIRSGKLVTIPADEIRHYGDRANWGGKAILRRDGVIRAYAAHMRALQNILCEYIAPNEEISCSMNIRGRKIKLFIKSSPSDGIKGPDICEPEPTPPEGDILATKDLGDFYLLISSFEQDIRNFLREKLGKGFHKRLKKDLPNIVQGWNKRRETDVRWGISPESDLINYTLLTDYIQIIRKYKNMFSDNDEELNDVMTQLKIFANQGRNPFMHCRTLTMQKYYTTRSAVDFLRQWIKRKSNPVDKVITSRVPSTSLYIVISSCSASKDDSIPISSNSNVVSPSNYIDDESIVSELIGTRDKIFADSRACLGRNFTYAYDLYIRAGRAYTELYRTNYERVKNILLKGDNVKWFFLSGGYGVINALEATRSYQATFNRSISYQKRIPFTASLWAPIIPHICDSIFQKFQPEYVYIFGSKDYTRFIKNTNFWKTKDNIKIFESTGSAGVYWLSPIINSLAESIINDDIKSFNEDYGKFNKQNS